MVVLHGGPGAHHEYLLPQLLFLAETRDCLLYDQRGGGRSKTDDRTPITWRTHVDDLTAVLAERAPGPLTLVGYSWGALLTLLYTLEAAAGRAGPIPARLVLLDPAPASRAFRARFEAEFARRQAGPEVQALRAALDASGLREQDPAAYRQRTFELSVAGYFADPARARDLTPFRVTGRVQQSTWESLGDFDLLPALRTLRVPSLVVHGRQDPIPLESAVAIADALGAEHCWLDDCGHVPYVEQPTALRDAVTRFLDTTEGLVTG
jgi:pimeloyl-ACP methyl ester carboxylesterase